MNKFAEFMKRNSNTFNTVIVTLFVVFILMWSYGTHLNNKEAEALKIQEQKKEMTSKFKADSDFRLSFMEGCTDENVLTFSQCDCMYDFILDQYGSGGMIDIAKEYAETGTISDKYTDGIFEACIE